MAESEKRGFFGRLFGGGKKEAPESEPEAREEDVPSEEEVAQDLPAGSGQAAESAETAQADASVGSNQPLVMPVALAPAISADPAAAKAPVDDPDSTDAADEVTEAALQPSPPGSEVVEFVDDETPDVDAETLEPESPDPETSEADTPSSGHDETQRDESAGEVVETEPSPQTLGIVASGLSSDALETPAPKRSWIQRLRDGLSRSSSALGDGIISVFRKRKLDAETIEELEDLLIQADLGADTAMTITERLAEGRYDKEISEEEVRRVLAEEIEKVLAPVARPLDLDTGHKPHVVLLVGVNGTGKTTTIGKLAAKLNREGKKVMLAAGDTFRAAAVEQLRIWGERTGSTVVSRPIGADAAGLVFDAMKQAKDAACDVLLIDTAGRLQNRAELMAELEKVVRVIKKHDPEAPHTVLLTLDATTGQNAMSQVEIFGRTAGVTGLVMTKLDGTARGGILVAIAARHGLPVHFIGIGEGIDDLEPFTAKDFAGAIAGMTN
ncbi:signal recognition particle-docking protein FtsY [Breoghania corrubedonensis]|uniref:Signal recognition particle receptor FtsY n=1 Tax=Breoghania corrubedonensis TaxID=665038 RepID=A0A2T5VHU1_9HYPH|nr:signal recognition particle-docking protein FtsY [Breoghania corrubedonensis]PTW63329.1 signal recognition particle-docking protein FtsY [Breoghania corrubedonensis]